MLQDQFQSPLALLLFILVVVGFAVTAALFSLRLERRSQGHHGLMWKSPARSGAKQEPLPVLLPEPLASEVDSLVEVDRFVHAVRLVREHTGLGLLVATRAVRHRQTQ